MSESKVIIDDVIGLLPQEHQGIVKLAVTLSDTLSAKEQAQKKSNSLYTMLKNLLTYIAEEMLLGSYNWRDFIKGYLEDSNFIFSDDYDNIAKKYFGVTAKLKIPTDLAVVSLYPVINKLTDKLKEQHPEEYSKLTGEVATTLVIDEVDVDDSASD